MFFMLRAFYESPPVVFTNQLYNSILETVFIAYFRMENTILFQIMLIKSNRFKQNNVNSGMT